MNTTFFKEYIESLQNRPEDVRSLSIKGHIFNNVEVVSSSKDIRNGLMWRRQMNDDNAMLFMFDISSIHRFWMKNTFIPLDVIFLDSKKRVVSFYSMDVEDPKTDKESEHEYEKRLNRYSSIKPCKYAIEMNQGICKDIDLHIGDIIDF